MSESNRDFYPGKITLDEVHYKKKGTSTDLIQLVAEINVYSSIIDPVVTSEVVIIDSKNVLSNLPIESGDNIVMRVSYFDRQVDFTMFIIGIDEINIDEKQRMYTLKCTSELGFVSLYKHISQHFNGTVSDIAAQVITDSTSEKTGLWEPSIGIQNIISPQWNPLKLLTWLARRATSTVDTTRFYFWQDSKMVYNFAPIERVREIYRNLPVPKFTYGLNNQLIGPLGSQKPNSEAVMNTIIEIDFENSFDLSAQIKKGSLGGVMFVTDISTKTMKIITDNYWDSFRGEKSLNGYPSWQRMDDVAKGKQLFPIIASNISRGITLNEVFDRSSIRGTSVDKSQVINIVVHGNQTLDVGQVIEIDIPSPEPRTDSMRDKIDRRWSGKYFVVAKRDMYNVDGVKTALTLAKESLLDKEVAI